MHLLIIGDWQWPQYEQAFAKGLEHHGVKVSQLALHSFFKGRLGKFQKALPLPLWTLRQINRAILKQINREKPDFILFWRPTHILPSTLNTLTRWGVKIISYNNDDPFGPDAHGNAPWHHRYLWYWYKKGLPYFDLNFFYRQINCAEAKSYGAKHADVLLPYFLPWKDMPVCLSEKEQPRFNADVVFAGHYEPDGRADSINALVDAGMKVKIWGGGYWTRQLLGPAFEKIAPIVPANGDMYGKALTGAKICLCFLSKLNRDTYTRRCFEIPAYKKVMLAERTDDLMQLFREDEEACFFSSNIELVEKAKWLASDDATRERIATAGYNRVWQDGHDVYSRAKEFLEKLKE